MKKSPMLDALRQRKAGALDIHIIIEDPAEKMAEGDNAEALEGALPSEMADMDEEAETRELGQAPAGAMGEEVSKVEHADEAQDKMLIEDELSKFGLGKRFSKKK